MVAIDILQQQATSLTSHFKRLIDDSRHLGCDILGMRIIGKPDKRHIIRNAQAYLLDSGKGCEGDDIVKSQDGIGAVFSLQQPHSCLTTRLRSIGILFSFNASR